MLLAEPVEHGPEVLGPDRLPRQAGHRTPRLRGAGQSRGLARPAPGGDHPGEVALLLVAASQHADRERHSPGLREREEHGPPLLGERPGPVDLTREVVRAYLDHAIEAPDELTMLADLTLAPPAPFVPPEWVGKPVLMIIAVWCGEPEAGAQALAPLRALADPVADLVSWIPYPAIYEFTAHLAEPHGASIRMMFADELSEAALDASIEAVRNSPSDANLVHLRGLGGAFGRVANDATAFGHRDRRYFVALIAVWLDEAADPAPHEAWTLSLWERLRPEGEGVYVNFLEDEGRDRVHEAYPPATYDRLAAVKRRYDPANLFRFNQNVTPAS